MILKLSYLGREVFYLPNRNLCIQPGAETVPSIVEMDYEGWFRFLSEAAKVLKTNKKFYTIEQIEDADEDALLAKYRN